MPLELWPNILKMIWYKSFSFCNQQISYLNGTVFVHLADSIETSQIVDKIRVQMDAFLEDGSHEATIAVVRALVVAVPHTTDRLKDYILYILTEEL